MKVWLKRAMMTSMCSMVVAGVGPASGQTLVGDTVSFWQVAQLNGESTLDSLAIVTSPLHEFAWVFDGAPIYTWNVEATSIRLDSRFTFYSPYFNSGFAPSSHEIRDLDFVGEPDRFITGVSVTFSDQISVHDSAPIDWPSFSASNVTFTADSVRISMGGYRFPRDSFVQIDLITAVPTPGSMALLAMMGVLGARRRRRCDGR